jgi:hypothetical protein
MTSGCRDLRELTIIGMTIGLQIACNTAARVPATSTATAPPVKRVLLISVDGLHSLDLVRWMKKRPDGALSQMSHRGVLYTNASTPFSDSAPGLISLVTGASPATTGVLYSDTYDRALSPAGSDCTKKGAAVLYDERANKNPDALDAGGGLDPAKLPRDPANGCKPVYPHSYLRVNTVFEVARQAGGRTAWNDQHPAYVDFLLGPSGKGLDDIYAPDGHAPGVKQSVERSEAFDDLGVTATLNQIGGKDHAGQRSVGVPMVFGMTFVSVSVAQKLKDNGYVDADGSPSAGVENALGYVDASIGRIIDALKSADLYSSTAIVVSAKHGNSPMDSRRRRIVDEDLISKLIDHVGKDLAAHVTVDTVALIWLKDQAKTRDVVARLRANAGPAGILKVYWGDSLALKFPDPSVDSRTPDIIVQPELGVMYVEPKSTKLAEHGGQFDEDTNVALLVSAPGATGTRVTSPVQTTEVAPTILKVLGLDPLALLGVKAEGTPVLPGFER